MDRDQPSLDDLLTEAGINTIQRNLCMVFNNADSAAVMLVARNMAEDMTQAQSFLRKTCEDVLLETAITDAHQHVNLVFKNRNTSSASASRFLALTYPESSMVIAVFDTGVATELDKKVFSACLDRTNIHPTVGIHPRLACSITIEVLDEVVKFIMENIGKVCAIGEVGLDTKWASKGVDLQSQKDLLKIFALLARFTGLPLILHLRTSHNAQFNAVHDAVVVLQEANLSKDHPINIHAWGGKLDDAEHFLKAFPNTFFGIGKLIKSLDSVAEVAVKLPLDRLLVETDSPHMGTLREGSNFVKIMAEKRNIAPIELLRAMRKNMETLLKPLCSGSSDASIVTSAITEWAMRKTTLDTAAAKRFVDSNT